MDTLDLLYCWCRTIYKYRQAVRIKSIKDWHKEGFSSDRLLFDANMFKHPLTPKCMLFSHPMGLKGKHWHTRQKSKVYAGWSVSCFTENHGIWRGSPQIRASIFEYKANQDSPESISTCLCHCGCTDLHTQTPCFAWKKTPGTNEENKYNSWPMKRRNKNQFLFESKLQKWELAPHLNQGA